jgi:phosphonate transport system substrate-binding protein
MPSFFLAGLVLLSLAAAAGIALAPLDPDPLAGWNEDVEALRADTDRTVIVHGEYTQSSIGCGAAMAFTADYIEARVPVRFRLRVFDNEAEYLDRLRGGEVDFMHFGPLEYVRAREAAGVEPIAAAVKGGDTFYEGVIATIRPDIRSIEGIRGRRVTYVDRTSASGFLFPLALALEHGIDPRRDCRLFEPSGSHHNAILNLYQGRYDAAFVIGGMIPEAMANLPGRRPADRSDTVAYVEIARTVPIPTALHAVSPAFRARAPDLVERIQKVLLEMGNDSEARAFLQRGGLNMYGFAPITDADYASVRRVRALLRRHGYVE